MGPILSDFICLLFDCDSVRVQNMRAELDKKKDVLVSMESELAKASHWNDQVVAPFHRCDMMLSKFTEQVSHLGDRWRRINGQIDTRHVGSWSYFIISFKNRPYNNVTHCRRCPPYCLYLSRFFFSPDCWICSRTSRSCSATNKLATLYLSGSRSRVENKTPFRPPRLTASTL